MTAKFNEQKNNAVELKNTERLRIEKEIQDFLKNGGEINVLHRTQREELVKSFGKEDM